VRFEAMTSLATAA